jgi:hypothetical protein
MREANVMSKLIGDVLPRSSQNVTLVKNTVNDNIGRHLLHSFDEESEDEDAEKEVQQHLVQQDVLKCKMVWGTIMATRMSSRIERDGKSAIEKAQESLKI